MRFAALPIALVLLSIGFAQEEPTTDQATIRYHEWRQRNTKPTYGLAKVEALVAKLKKKARSNDSFEATIGLSAKELAQLSFKERFTYNMIHGEYYTQNCDMFMATKNEQNMIYAHAPEGYEDDNYWSDAQRAWFKKNRSRIIPLVRETMRKDAGANVKAAILAMGAHELIPDIVRKYEVDHKDHDLLTTLNELMKDAKFGPFTKTPIYAKLYSDDAVYRSGVEATKENRDRIISLAKSYYASKSKR